VVACRDTDACGMRVVTLFRSGKRSGLAHRGSVNARVKRHRRLPGLSFNSVKPLPRNGGIRRTSPTRFERSSVVRSAARPFRGSA
jgi:hypothetical protein